MKPQVRLLCPVPRQACLQTLLEIATMLMLMLIHGRITGKRQGQAQTQECTSPRLCQQPLHFVPELLKSKKNDGEHAEFMRFFLRVFPGCAPLSPQAGKTLTEEDMDVVLNPKQDGLREQTRTETSFYNFVTQHRLSRACSNSLMQMLRHDFF